MIGSALASDFEIALPRFVRHPARKKQLTDRIAYERTLNALNALHQSAATKMRETVVQAPTLVAPGWIVDVVRRLDNSTRSISSFDPGTYDATWISEQTAAAAKAFFKVTADLLPQEPYIYAAHTGELVAECAAEVGRLTAIISPSHTLLFSSIDGGKYLKVDPATVAVSSTRLALQELLGKAPAEGHEKVETWR